MSFSWISHNAKKSTLHPLAMGRKALSLTKSSPQSSGGHCVHMGEAQSSRQRGPRLLRIGTCQGDPGVLPEVRKENWRLGGRVGTCLFFQEEVQVPRYILRSVRCRSLDDCT